MRTPKPVTQEDLEKNVQLPHAVKMQARMQALRLKEKEPLVNKGTWPHWLQMPLADLVAKLRASVEELVGLACVACAPTEGRSLHNLRLLRQAGDVANWAMFIAHRVMCGARLEKIDRELGEGK